jgi:hypothetical protein
MPYTPSKLIEQQRQMAAQLAHSPSNKDTLGQLVAALKGYGAYKGLKGAGESEKANTALKTEEMQQLMRALQGGVAKGPMMAGEIPRFEHPDVASSAASLEMQKALSKAKGGTGQDPSDIKIYEYIEALPPHKRANFLLSQRGAASNYLNLGGEYRDVGGWNEGPSEETNPVIAGLSGALAGTSPLAHPSANPQPPAWSRPQSLPIGVKPDQTPGHKAAVVTAEAEARRQAELRDSESKRYGVMSGKTSQMKMLNESIDLAKGQTDSWFATGLPGQMTKGIGGTPGHNLEQTLATVKANIGFDRLQEMRDNSPTGGALGQVSEMENRLLQAVWGSLEQSQSEDQLISNLEKVRAQVKESWARIAQAYEADFGKPFPGFAGDGPQQGAAPQRDYLSIADEIVGLNR